MCVANQFVVLKKTLHEGRGLGLLRFRHSLCVVSTVNHCCISTRSLCICLAVFAAQLQVSYIKFCGPLGIVFYRIIFLANRNYCVFILLMVIYLVAVLIYRWYSKLLKIVI